MIQNNKERKKERKGDLSKTQNSINIDILAFSSEYRILPNLQYFFFSNNERKEKYHSIICE
jgi:hypothetical protein